MSSGVASDPKDSKFFFLMEESLFQRFYINFIYETEIVTFQKILPVVEMPMLYSSEGGKKDKTK